MAELQGSVSITLPRLAVPLSDTTFARHPAALRVGLALIAMLLLSWPGLTPGGDDPVRKGRPGLFAWLGPGKAAFTLLSIAGLIILGMSPS